jgi:hypothetical protein
MHLDRHVGAVEYRAQCFGAVLHRTSAEAAEDQVVHDQRLPFPDRPPGLVVRPITSAFQELPGSFP